MKKRKINEEREKYTRKAKTREKKEGMDVE